MLFRAIAVIIPLIWPVIMLIVDPDEPKRYIIITFFCFLAALNYFIFTLLFFKSVKMLPIMVSCVLLILFKYAVDHDTKRMVTPNVLYIKNYKSELLIQYTNSETELDKIKIMNNWYLAVLSANDDIHNRTKWNLFCKPELIKYKF